jgi:hypothetical protein
MQATRELLQKRENTDVRNIWQGEARHTKHNRFNLSAVNLTAVQVAKLPL